MALERLFRRNRPTRKEDDNSPAGLWLKCDACGQQIYRKDLVANSYVCPECDHHYRMPVDARVELLADDGTFELWSGGIEVGDPLGFVDTQPYSERMEKNRQKHGRPCHHRAGRLQHREGCDRHGDRRRQRHFDFRDAEQNARYHQTADE